MCWIFWKSESWRDDDTGEHHTLWTVGYYTPDGEKYSVSDHATMTEAANEVHYLNGGQRVYYDYSVGSDAL